MIDYYDAELQFKAVSVSQRLISGWAARHHSIDRVRDIIDPVASAKAVKRLKSPSDVGVFVGHNSQMLPVGIPQKIEATPQGLYTETYILKGPAGDNLLAVAKDLADHGLSLGMSIGYKTHDSKMEQTAHGRVRRLLDLSLVEFSYAASQAIANPDALVTAVKSRRRGHGEQIEAKMQYRVERDLAADRWLVYCDMDADGDEDDNRLIGTYDSQETANAVATALRVQQRPDDDEDDDDRQDVGAADKTQPPDPDISVKATWSTSYVNDLPNSAFLWVEDGADDDEGKRVPRSKRHLPYRDAAGKIDIPHLRAAISRLGQDVTLPGLNDAKKAQLQARARRLLDQAQSGGSKALGTASPPEAAECEPPEWKDGAPLALYGLGVRLCDLAEQLAAEFKAMETLGEETKGYQRVRAPLREQARAVASDLGKLLDFAEAIERGDDGRQRVAWYRAQLALSDV